MYVEIGVTAVECMALGSSDTVYVSVLCVHEYEQAFK
jgi:hypothetical protein